jgi:hypothetical protein
VFAFITRDIEGGEEELTIVFLWVWLKFNFRFKLENLFKYEVECKVLQIKLSPKLRISGSDCMVIARF